MDRQVAMMIDRIEWVGKDVHLEESHSVVLAGTLDLQE